MNKFNQEHIFVGNRNSERWYEKNLVSAPDQGGEIGDEGLAGLGPAMEGGEGMELAAGEQPVAGERRAVVDGAGGEVDPDVPIRPGEDGA